MLWALRRDEHAMWSVQDIADACGVPYGTAYSVLQRLHVDGLAAKISTDSAVGHTRTWFELTMRGDTIAVRCLAAIPDPVTALKSLSLDDLDALGR